MSLEKTGKQRIYDFFHVEWKSFWILLSMLLSNSLSIDFKGNRKKSIINIVLKVLFFIVGTAVSYIFFKVCITLNLFSLLPFVPMSVPSIILNILLLVSFFSVLFRVTKDLYFANDNKVLLTFPTNGNTLFLTRLSVSFINTYIRFLTLEIPFLIGYFLVSNYPVYMIFVILFIFLLVDLLFVLVSALLSVPLYFIKRFLYTHSIAKRILIVFFSLLIISVSSYIISIIPEKIDIFTNWSPYFTRIQEGLKFYSNKLSFFYETSKLYFGFYTGYTFAYFVGAALPGLYTFIAVVLSLPILFILGLSFASPFYLKLASGNDEIMEKTKKTFKREKTRSPFAAQARKELLLYFKDSDMIAYSGLFFYLPLLLALISKIFMAMDLNKRGLSYVQVAILLITLLITLSSNSNIAKIYSKEGGAFKLGRTYPVKNGLLITSKLFLPSLLGTVSIIASYIIISMMRKDLMAENLILGLGILFIYLGHLLYSASLDFTNPQSSFGDVSFLSNNENRSIIFAFAISALFSLLFYFFSNDPLIWIKSIQMTASFKLALFGLLFFALNVYLYSERIKYVYTRGERL